MRTSRRAKIIYFLFLSMMVNHCLALETDCDKGKSIGRPFCLAIKSVEQEIPCGPSDSLEDTYCRILSTWEKGKSCEDLSANTPEYIGCMDFMVGLKNFSCGHIDRNLRPKGEYIFNDIDDEDEDASSMVETVKPKKLVRKNKNDLVFRRAACGFGKFIRGNFQSLMKRRQINGINFKLGMIFRAYDRQEHADDNACENTLVAPGNKVISLLKPMLNLVDVPSDDSRTQQERINLGVNLSLHIRPVTVEHESEAGLPSRSLYQSIRELQAFLHVFKQDALDVAKRDNKVVEVMAGEMLPGGGELKSPFHLQFTPEGKVLMILDGIKLSNSESTIELKPLGKGGFKTVYEAIDLDLAMASIRRELSPPHSLAISRLAVNSEELGLAGEALRQHVHEMALAEWGSHLGKENIKGISAPPRLRFFGGQEVTPEGKIRESYGVESIQPRYNTHLGKYLDSIDPERPFPTESIDGAKLLWVNLGMAKNLLKGLSELHRQGISHRDIKPPNILIRQGDEGAPSGGINDFGSALSRDDFDRLRQEFEQEAEIPLASKNILRTITPSYASAEYKEAVLRKREGDERQVLLNLLGEVQHLSFGTDVWAMGKSLYELFSFIAKGDPMFSLNAGQLNDPEVLGRHIRSAKSASPLFSKLGGLIFSMLDPDPARRTTPAKAFVEINRLMDAFMGEKASRWLSLEDIEHKIFEGVPGPLSPKSISSSRDRLKRVSIGMNGIRDDYVSALKMPDDVNFLNIK